MESALICIAVSQILIYGAMLQKRVLPLISMNQELTGGNYRGNIPLELLPCDDDIHILAQGVLISRQYGFISYHHET